MPVVPEIYIKIISDVGRIWYDVIVLTVFEKNWEKIYTKKSFSKDHKGSIYLVSV